MNASRINLHASTLLPFGVLLLYGFFCYLMLDITFQYIPYNTDVAFLRIKQEEIALPYYRMAFFAHVYTSILVLPAGFIQFSRTILHRYPQFHRQSGWVYISVILAFAGPSGLIMGYHANGGWSSQLAFCTLAVLWLYFTGRALYHALKKQFILHQQFMYRSFALTLSAITLRAWKFLLVAWFHPKPMDVYRLVAWLGWVLNLLVAEWLIYHYLKKPKRM